MIKPMSGQRCECLGLSDPFAKCVHADACASVHGRGRAGGAAMEVLTLGPDGDSRRWLCGGCRRLTEDDRAAVDREVAEGRRELERGAGQLDLF